MMMIAAVNPEKLPISEFFRRYELAHARFGWIDVRSQGEFARAALPGFSNLPILTDAERHQVGLTFKQKGQDAAVRLGHELVDPARPERVAAWTRLIEDSDSREGVMICWRGGMRSEIAARWANEGGARVAMVEGGIKAIRGELLKSLEPVTFPKLLILAGLTGSGKTELLQKASFPKVDLEKIANHRGSSFGRKISSPQPPQARFENELALELRRVRRESTGAVLMEDESAMIGSCFIPRELKTVMTASPCVWVESPEGERAGRILREYILEPVEQGVPSPSVHEWMAASLERIRKKLGGMETSRIRGLLDEAFAHADRNGFRHAETESLHAAWITQLLALYYDPMYRYGFAQCERAGRKIVFRGTPEECLQWLKSN